MSFATILCPVDFSDASREAMRTACRLARESGGTVALLHVVQLPASVFASELPMAVPPPADLEAEAARELEPWRREAEALSGRGVECRVQTGVPWDAIVAALRAGRHDLAVLGTHGRTGLKHALIGSVAEKVVRHAPCPVLVVRPRA